jgi:membrane-associated phospholipid phosphatase
LLSAFASWTPSWLTFAVARRLAVAWVAIAALVFVTGSFVVAEQPGFDAELNRFVAANRADWALGFARFLVAFTQSYVVFPLIVLVGMVGMRRRADFDVFWVPAIAGAGGFAISVVVKFVIDRPRPPTHLAAVEGFGPAFPSGHSIRAAAVAGAVAWLLTRWYPHRRAAAWSIAIVVPAAVGASRVYQGAHWATDVLAGIAVGAAWLAVVLSLAARAARSGDLGEGRGDGSPAGKVVDPQPAARASVAPDATRRDRPPTPAAGQEPSPAEAGGVSP